MWFMVSLCTLILATTMSQSHYFEERQFILGTEESKFLGQNQVLTVKEEKVNKLLLEVKQMELRNGYRNATQFPAALHFSEGRPLIRNSKIYQCLRKFPKGACLHMHLLAGVSIDYVIENFTYLDHLYAGEINGFFKLKFFENNHNLSSSWSLVSDLRQNNSDFDVKLKRELSLVFDNSKNSAVDVWSKFKRTFTAIYDLVCFRPVFQKYVAQLLEELYQDNIMYVELKGTIMPLYELNGTNYSYKQFFEIFIKIVEDFQKTHPGFLGARYIHSIYRGVDKDVLEAGLNQLIVLQKQFPNFIAGFDFVGCEEEGHPLLFYKDQLEKASQQGLKFFFHSGETNWYGHTDLNLIDALLLNSTRIGHAFALSKHPELIKLGKTKNIPIELCPISNQILRLNEDPRNHPTTNLMAVNYPVVIGNDDPAVWNATGLSDDWYVTFMAMTPKNVGLKFLKQVAINSIEYSAMDDKEKQVATEKWTKMWNIYIDDFLTDYNMV